MTKKFKKLAPYLLIMAMVLSVMPNMSMQVSAEGTDKAIMMGTSSIGVWDKNNALENLDTIDKIVMGEFGGYPITWIMIDNNGLMLSEHILEITVFDNSRQSYYSSDFNDLQGIMAGYYHSTLGLTYQEQVLINDTTLTQDSMHEEQASELIEQKFFPLSKWEVDRIGVETALGKGFRHIDPSKGTMGWWLRTSSTGGTAVKVVPGAYRYTTMGINDPNGGSRPAFHLNLPSVLFISAAEGGKLSDIAAELGVVSTATSTDWKMTVKDSEHTLTSAYSMSELVANSTVAINYTGASTGKTLSAMVVNRSTNEIISYGNVASNITDTGTASVTLPTGFDNTVYKLVMFTETLNGDNKTDYASELVEVENYIKDITEAAINDDSVIVIVNKVDYIVPTNEINGSYKFIITVLKGEQTETTAEQTITIPVTELKEYDEIEGEAITDVEVKDVSSTSVTDGDDHENQQADLSQIGKHSNIWLYVILAILLLGGIGCIVYRRKIQQKKIKIGVIIGVIIIAAIIIVIHVILPTIRNSTQYNDIGSLAEDGKYDDEEVIVESNESGDDQDAYDMVEVEVYYQEALDLMEQQKYEEAIATFEELGDYKDSQEKINELYNLEKEQFLEARELIGNSQYMYCNSRFAVGLNLNGTVVATGNNYSGQCDVGSWRDIVAISIGANHTVGLKSDGTVMAVGNNRNGQCDVGDWTDIVTISSCTNHTVGLKSDGTVVAVGTDRYRQTDVDNWTDIVAISVSEVCTLALKANGMVVATGENGYLPYDQSWRDIVEISTGSNHIVGLKSDGTLTTAGDNDYGQRNVTGWGNIVSISISDRNTVGLTSLGSVIAAGDNEYGQCDVGGWRDMVAISASTNHTVGLKSDGTVVATGDNEYGQCDVGNWTNIVAVSSAYRYTVGLKSDGTVVATGDNEYGQCDVSDWNLFE